MNEAHPWLAVGPLKLIPGGFLKRFELFRKECNFFAFALLLKEYNFFAFVLFGEMLKVPFLC
jgi:hypothetical protein